MNPPLERVLRVVDALAEAEVFEIRWFGGEFLTFGGWQDVVRYARDKDFFMGFVSNCTRMTRESARLLATCGITGGAVSIHGPEAVHDRVVDTPGAFRRAIEGIRNCGEENIGISVLFTPTQSNYRSVYDLARWFKENRVPVNEIVIGRLCPCGEAAGEWEAMRLSLKDYRRLFQIMKAINRDFGIKAYMGDAFPLCVLPYSDWELVIGCWQGTGFGQVSYTGDVKSCTVLGGTYGNVLETPLTEIWTERLKPMRSLSFLPLQCRLCPHFCGGGCSASRPGTTHYAADEFIPHPLEENLITLTRRIPGFLDYFVRNSLDWLKERAEGRSESPPPSLTSKPQFKCRHRIRKDLEGYIGYFKGFGILTFDDDAARIIGLMDGRRSIGEIAVALGQSRGGDTRHTQEDVLAFLKSINHGGLIAYRE